MHNFTQIKGGVTAAKGFRASGVAAGIKYADRRDLALLVADQPCAVAAMFTTNKVTAAPVIVSRKHAAGGLAQAVIINSGNANACTGEAGLRNAYAMTRLTAVALDIDVTHTLVCSTGVIGVELPVERVAAGIDRAVAALSNEGGADAAAAIMTTDTVAKQHAVRLRIDNRDVVIGGMTKGSGMIEPNMATMLAFITTDAAIKPAALKLALREAVELSFNRLVVDGDQSTNDTIIAMASALADNSLLDVDHPQWHDFVDALKTVCLELGKQIVMDGEGATKLVSVRVQGAESDADAQLAARAIAKSPLVKTAFYGMDPNWGRIIAAVGYSGANVIADKAQISLGSVMVYNQGEVASADVLRAAASEMQAPLFDVVVSLNLGNGADTVYTCDFSHDYVSINAEYTT